MTRAKAVIRAQALYRLAKDKAATVAEAELAAEHLEKLRRRFDLRPEEILPRDHVRRPPPPPPPPPPTAPQRMGLQYIIVYVNGQPVPVPVGGIMVNTTGWSTTTAAGHIFFG